MKIFHFRKHRFLPGMFWFRRRHFHFYFIENLVRLKMMWLAAVICMLLKEKKVLDFAYRDVTYKWR